MRAKQHAVLAVGILFGLAMAAVAQEQPIVRLNIDPPAAKTDKSVKLDYDIVYVRAPRRTDGKEAAWAEFSRPISMEPGADLMLLHPDGTEEVLVRGDDGSVMDPYVSFDGESVYYAKFIDEQHTGSDIHRIHVPSRKIVRLTDQTFSPNTGAAEWSEDFRTPAEGKSSLHYGVYNLGPCPIPGGKVMFTSNRNAYVPPRGYPVLLISSIRLESLVSKNVNMSDLNPTRTNGLTTRPDAFHNPM